MALILAALTGAIHFWIAIERLLLGLTTNGLIFLAMAAGYFVGLGLFAAGVARRWLLRLAPLYVLGLIGAWLWMGERTALAYLDKAVEVGLLLVLLGLLYLDHRDRLREFD